ncbi:MAG: tetratricopeptide repeat protein, partial [Betaproteobacteria bacterium]
MTSYRMLVVSALLFIWSGAMCGAAQVPDNFGDANRLYKEGKRADALDRLNAALVQHPKDARARFLKGVILAEQNKTQDAITVFNDLTEDYPELPEPYNNLAVLYAGQGDYDKARKALEMAIRTHPSYAVAHENLGDIYATLASQAYDKALQLDSTNATARKKLALIKELVPAKTASSLARVEPDKTAPSKSGTEAVVTPKSATKPVTGEKPPVDKAVTPPATPSAAAPATGSSAQNDAILRMLQDWAAAWSSGDVKTYLSFYAPDFRPNGKESRSHWEAGRRERLTNTKKIQVSTSSPKIKFTDNNHASVTFR